MNSDLIAIETYDPVENLIVSLFGAYFIRRFEPTYKEYYELQLHGFRGTLMMPLDWKGERVLMRQHVNGYYSPCPEREAEMAARFATKEEKNAFSKCFR
jgi:hypothetical protein